MIRIWLISLTYFSTLYLSPFGLFCSVNNVLNLLKLIVFRYLLLLFAVGESAEIDYKVSLRGSCTVPSPYGRRKVTVD